MKTKIKSYSDEAKDFRDKEISKAVSDYTCLAVIIVNSALEKDESYYLQVFLKECEYIHKEEIRHIIRDPDIFPDKSDESDEEIV